jgi:hypothetical protein
MPQRTGKRRSECALGGYRFPPPITIKPNDCCANIRPINYLILIEEIDVLPRLYGRVVISPAVNEELMRSGAPVKVREWINSLLQLKLLGLGHLLSAVRKRSSAQRSKLALQVTPSAERG